MHLASIENISKSFGVRTLFKDISFHISEGDKIALIARNGFGKSTLMNIIRGADTADKGEVWIHKDYKIVTLNQEQHFDASKSIWDTMLAMDNAIVQVVKKYETFIKQEDQDEHILQDLLTQMDELNAWNFESKFSQILSKLNIHHVEQKVGSLSGGQKKRVALAQALIEADIYAGQCILLLDEPTNHLDVEMIEWLEDYLSSQRITLLMVTHDRYFLDEVCNTILEIEDEKVYTHKGNYAYYLAQKAHRIEVAASELQKDKNIFRKELEWIRKQPKARTTKSKSRQDAFEEIEERVSQKKEDTDVQLQVKMTRLGGKILEMKKVYKQYENLVLLKGFDYTFKKGERIGIVGKNGVGKSTFINIAMQKTEPDSGKINHGDTVVFGYFSQEGLQFKEDKRVIEWVKDIAEFFPLADGTKLGASKFLERFAFSPEQQYTYLSLLSGGEKRRLQLLGILFKNPNFLVLDEPTNDLDLQTLQILESFLYEYQGCILLVSHDRYFMDKLVDHLFVFEGNGNIQDFPGNYTQYRIAQLNEQAQNKDKEEQKQKLDTPQTEKKKELTKEAKLTFNEKREMELLEKEIPLLEDERKRNETILMDAHATYETIQQASQEIATLIAKIEEKELRWLELSEKVSI
ncbi:MAG: ABC-F family ATP-binding cassette domain-containing protein [Chitinophagaceae bacterium]